MKNYLPNKFFKLKNKILKNLRKVDKTNFNYKIIIQELVYLILKHENLLFDLSSFSTKFKILKHLVNMKKNLKIKS